MLMQYSMLSKCLAELKKSDLPVIEKLRIEVQLIQTKRILLDRKVEQRVTGSAGSEQQFSELYEQLLHVCRSGGVSGGVDRLKELVQEVKDGLGIEPTGRNLYTPQAAHDTKDRKVLSANRKPTPGVRDISR